MTSKITVNFPNIRNKERRSYKLTEVTIRMSSNFLIAIWEIGRQLTNNFRPRIYSQISPKVK